MMDSFGVRFKLKYWSGRRFEGRAGRLITAEVKRLKSFSVIFTCTADMVSIIFVCTTRWIDFNAACCENTSARKRKHGILTRLQQ